MHVSTRNRGKVHLSSFEITPSKYIQQGESRVCTVPCMRSMHAWCSRPREASRKTTAACLGWFLGLDATVRSTS